MFYVCSVFPTDFEILPTASSSHTYLFSFKAILFNPSSVFTLLPDRPAHPHWLTMLCSCRSIISKHQLSQTTFSFSDIFFGLKCLISHCDPIIQTQKSVDVSQRGRFFKLIDDNANKQQKVNKVGVAVEILIIKVMKAEI